MKSFLYLFNLFFFSIQIFANQDMSQEIKKVALNYHLNSGNFFKNVNEPIEKKTGMTILMCAAEQNSIELTKFLLNLNADHLIKKTNSDLIAYDFINKENKELEELLKPADLTIVGFAKFNDGIGRVPIGLIEHLSDKISINFINTKPKAIAKENNEKILSKNTISILDKNHIKFNKVILFTDLLTTKFYIEKLKNYKDRIKIAFSVFETTKIPSTWVNYLNNYFDIAIVADEYFEDVYRNSGVKIPIFVLPHGIFLDDFLKKPKTKYPKNKFIFGCLSSIDNRKNQKLLIDAFIEEFKNDKNVKLKINGRNRKKFEDLNKYIIQKNITNIQLNHENLSWAKYIEFMRSIDCYVNISKGEGFSVTPREALAMGIPCILTNNTAQKTICNTGYVYSIKSEILERANYYTTHTGDLGHFFNCSINDVKKALRSVYKYYDFYLKKSVDAKNWVIQYDWKNLNTKFLNFIKPKKIILGQKNKVTDEFLMTDSKILYEKYLKLYQKGIR